VPDAHLRVAGITKRFGGVTAVDDVSFEVPRGAFATLLGPSGCGKTTTLRMIAGFYDPDEGDIVLAGRRINNLPAHRRGTAMVFQDYALFPHMSVRDNVGYGLKLAKVSRDERERRVRETLAFVGLTGLEDRWPNQLSGGQQQRVAVARALVIEPEVLLLDEPLSNLDAKLREQLRVELRIMQRRLGMTFVYVTHDQEEALSLSDWIAVMNKGKVEQAGPPWEIYYHPRTAFLADFVGAVNLVPARVAGVGDDEVTVAFGPHRAPVRRPADVALSPGQEVKLCVRPESFAIAPAGSPGGQDGLVLAGTIARRAFLGDTMRYWVKVDDREWIVDQPDPGAGAPLDGAVSLSLRPDRVHLIAT
jgi:ABC-type Fe3+/spermidine/putrescine transport system ATPase subunit